MELILAIMFGIGFGFFIPFIWQVGIIIIVFLFLFFSKDNMDGFGVAIIIGIFLYIGIGVGIGNGLDYLNKEHKSNNLGNFTLNQNLPELICKNENNTFILTNYKIDKDNIVNLKTDQIFNKSNCSLK